MTLWLGAFAVARIALVKPDKARGVENLILQMAQRGQITEKASLTLASCLCRPTTAIISHDQRTLKGFCSRYAIACIGDLRIFTMPESRFFDLVRNVEPAGF